MDLNDGEDSEDSRKNEIDDFVIDDEIVDAKKQIDELNSLLDALNLSIVNKNKLHQDSLYRLRYQKEEAKKEGESSFLELKESQEEELQIYKKNALDDLILAKKSFDSKNNFKNSGLKEEIKKYELYEAQLQLQLQKSNLSQETEQIKMDTTYKQRNNYKRKIKTLENDVFILQEKIKNFRRYSIDTLNDISASNNANMFSRDEFTKKLRKIFMQRENEYKRNIEIAKKVLESEKNHIKREDEVYKQTIITIRTAKNRLKMNFEKKAKDAIKEIQEASQTLVKDKNSRSNTETIFRDTFSSTNKDKLLLNNLKRKEISIENEVSFLKDKNNKAAEFLISLNKKEEENDDSLSYEYEYDYDSDDKD